MGHDLVEIVIDGVPLLDLVREAELPYARSEQLERTEEFAPEPAPLLAGGPGHRRPFSGAAEVLPEAMNPLRGEDLLKSLSADLQDSSLRQGKKGAVLDGLVILRRRTDRHGEDLACPLKLLDSGRVDLPPPLT
ncbi:hypothetical protein [Nonomuraea aurantiaca]|uniref:hypothetical protein n=1 Tax=Nonomuraea aurantiaca TaxID=2878562 RepID=UPI001CD97084|nr:hypothetical protein [Nonomuraea aurantiaca]MCA2226413.1 hypothetical protein [Nonomuraea aurantiaca]